MRSRHPLVHPRVIGTCLAVLIATCLLPRHYPRARSAQSTTPTCKEDRVVYIGGNLSDEQLIVLGATISGGTNDAVLLLDSTDTRQYIKHFLTAYKPKSVIPIGTFDESQSELKQQWNEKSEPIIKWKNGPPAPAWERLFPKADRIIVCPAEPRTLLLQAACLGGVLRAPLFVTHGAVEEGAELRHWCEKWNPQEIFGIGTAIGVCKQVEAVRVIELADVEAVAAAHGKELAKAGPIQTVVLTNPADIRLHMPATSALAPWIAGQRRAALAFTNDRGDDATAAIRSTLAHAELSHADNLIIVGNLDAIPTEKRPNPMAGKDMQIEMEPMTPAGAEPFSLATGRLFHRELAVVPLMLARQRLLEHAQGARKALVVSNPGGTLPLLETFSRHTAREFRNNGYATTTLFDDATPDAVRDFVQHCEVFLWEGHHRTLTEQFGMPRWQEPLQPSLVFLQSCLALDETETRGLLRRGAVGLVGSATRTYSASGGAFTLAFFNAMLYDRTSLGGSLRQAKNFLLCYTLLKEKRLGEKATLTGANVRSSWAFTLWGDPTLRLPSAEPPAGAITPIRQQVKGNTILLSLPPRAYDVVHVDRFTAEMMPNARLAGLLTPDGEDSKRLVPFLFSEVPLPQVPAGKSPILSSRLPERNYVSVWDSRRRTVYILAVPRVKDSEEVRFRVAWE